MTSKNVLFSIIFLFANNLTFSQTETWYFGLGGGLEFKSNGVKVLKNSIMNPVYEGSSVATDSSGRLLFYTEGVNLYYPNYSDLTKPHKKLANLSLNSCLSTTQAVTIVQESNKNFLIFTTDCAQSLSNNSGLRVTKIEILGNKYENYFLNIIYSNIELLYPFSTTLPLDQRVFPTEKLTSVKSNSCVEWVISHGFETDPNATAENNPNSAGRRFYCFKIENNQLNTIPIISTQGEKLHQYNTHHLESHANMIGELKGSPNGKLLASVVFVDNFLEIFSFDDKIGQVTKCLANIDLGRSEPWMYSVEFTHDNHYLYVSQPGDNYTNYNASIFRLDLSLIDLSKSPKDNGILLLAQKLDIITIPQSNANYYFGALKRAPSFYNSDEIIVARPDNSFLSIISNATNAQAKYIESNYSLDHLIGQLGFPQTNVMDIIELSELGRDTNLCIGDTLSLKFGSVRTLWSNGVRGKEITVNSPGWYWAEIKTPCVTFRDSILVTSKNCTSTCELACDSIEWIDWIQKTTIMLTGMSKSYGSVDLNIDSNTGTINPLFTNLILNSNKYFPKVLNSLPTLWMPGIPSITKLIHQVNVNKINSKKDILLLLGNFPNSRKYSTSQIGKLRVLDRKGIKLDLSNVCLVFSDASGSASPMKITNLGNEMLFLVDDISNADGEILVFNNLPDSSSIIEVEHNNENSSSYDGIFLTVGFPQCCKNDSITIDTASCKPILINGITYSRSGSYKIENKIQDCIRITFLNFKLIPSLVLNLPKDTTLCNGSALTLNSPFENTKWSTGQIGKQIVVSSKGKYWATVDSTCGLVSDTINISFKDCKADSCGISLNQSCLPSGQVELSVYDKNGNLVKPQNRNIELFWDIKQGPNNLAYSLFNMNPIVLNENIKFSMTSKTYSWKANDPKTIEYADICQSRIIDNSLSTCLGPCENFKLILSSCNDDYDKNNNLNFPNSLCKSVCSSDCQFIVGIFDLNGNLLSPAEYDIKWSTGSTDNYITLMQPYYNTLSVEVKKGDCIWNGRYWKSCNLYKKLGDGSLISERNSITKSELILIYTQSKNIILYDINGNQVSKLRLIAGDVSAGVYLVQTKLENGSQNFEKIFIKDE